MYKSDKISNYQLFALLTGFMLGSALVVNPFSIAQSDAWLAFLLGFVGGFILLNLYVSITKLNQSKTLIEILKSSFGSIPGSIIGLLYVWYFIHLAALVLRNFGEYSLTVTYPDTPILFIIACFAFVISLAVRYGIEVMGRISEIFILMLILILTFVFIALTNSFDVENLKPFLSKGFTPVLKASFSILTFPFGETIAFLMIFPHVNKQKSIYKSSIISIVVLGILLFTVTVRNTMVLGSNLSSREVFPSHTVFEMIPGINVDPLLDINLKLAGIIKASICIYAAVTGISEIFNLKEYKLFVFPVVVFCVSLSIWVYENLMEMIQWITNIWPIYSIPFQIIFPVLILIISLINKKRNQKTKRTV